MKRTIRIVAAAALASLLMPGSVMPHHSPVMFNLDVTDFAITGEIKYVDLRNPHSVIELLVEDSDGSTAEWYVEFSSVNLLLRRGWDLDRIQAGDTVTCVGNPSREGKSEMYMWSIVLDDGTEFGR